MIPTAPDIPTGSPVLSPDVARIGIICGCDIVRKIVFDRSVETGGVGNNDAVVMLKMLDPPVDIRRMHLTPGYFRQSQRWTLQYTDVLWNLISDVDQNPATLDVAEKVVNDAVVPVINPPNMIWRTRRHSIAQILGDLDNVHAPKVLLIKYPTLERVRRLVSESDFSFPAIVRKTGTHNGDVVGVFSSPEEMEQIYGDRKNEYYLIEFVDVRRDDGLYRKTRFFFVGDEVVTRQHIISEDWSVHGRSSRGIMQSDERLVAEGRTMLVDGFEALPDATRAAVHSIRQRVGLDYFGLDCCIMDDGRVVVFECNATMNFNPFFRNPATQHNRAALPRLLAAIRKMIADKTGIAPSA